MPELRESTTQVLDMPDDLKRRFGSRARRLSSPHRPKRYVRFTLVSPITNQFPREDTIGEAIVFCQTCRHGGHASHIMEWFFGDYPVDCEGEGDGREREGRAHDVCAVPDCDCHCADEM